MNHWNLAKIKNSIFISTNGFNATRTEDNNANRFESVLAQKGFTISINIPGPLLFYYEVTAMSSCDEKILVGLASGSFPTIGSCVGFLANSYAIDSPDHCWVSQTGTTLNGATKHKWSKGDVIGCGLVLNHAKKLCIFFTLNGIILGNSIPIIPTANTLYPTVSMLENVSIEANFGGDSAKPFKYDIQQQKQMLKQNGIKRQIGDADKVQPQPEQQRQHQMLQQPKGEQPLRKINRNFQGQNRLYHHLTTVNSVNELEEFALKNYCKSSAGVGKKFYSLNLPCKRKNEAEKCEFDIWAFRSKREYSCIHVYAYSHHNHPLISENKQMLKQKAMKRRYADEEEQEQPQQEHQKEPMPQQPNGQQPPKKMATNIQGQKQNDRFTSNRLNKYGTFPKPEAERNSRSEERLVCKNAIELMATDNVPKIHRTSDNIEWAFLETVPNFYQIHAIRNTHQCQPGIWDTEDKARRTSFVCRCRLEYGCPFKLLAIKTITCAYHIYNHGEHKHSVIDHKKGQKLAVGRQQPQRIAKRNNGTSRLTVTLRPAFTIPNVISQQNKLRMDDEEWSMEDERIEEEGVNENEEELDEWELNEEEKYNEEYEDEPEKQGTSAAAIGIVKKKWTPFKKLQYLPKFNKDDSTASAEGNQQQGQISQKENIEVEDEDEIIEVDAEGEEIKQRKIVLSNMDVSGFRPEEIKVESQGNKIVVRGEYKNRNEEGEHYQFVRPVSIPAGIDKSTIKCEMENDGRHLCIWAQKESAAEPCEIPIDVKHTVKKEAQIKVEFEIQH